MRGRHTPRGFAHARRGVRALVIAGAIVLTGGGAAGSLGAPAPVVSPADTGLKIESPSDGIGVVRSGSTVRFSLPVKHVDSWTPLFSPNRRVVNPARPKRVGEKALRFDRPGEYYIRLNRRHYTRVLVLNRTAPPRRHLLALFDFYVANHAWTTAHDAPFYADPPKYLKGFFVRHAPAAILCGPTQWMLQSLIRKRLGLPVRSTSFAGAVREGRGSRQILFGSHNIIEVYLPDIDKWVHVDGDAGVLPKWKSSLELWAAIKSRVEVQDTALTRAQMSAIEPKLRLHQQVVAHGVTRMNGSYRFSKRYLKASPLHEERQKYWRALAGGPAYHLVSYSPNPPIRELVDAGLLYTDGWSDPEVRDAARGEWTRAAAAGNGLTRDEFGDVVLSPAAVKDVLHRAYASEVAKEKWRRWYPTLSAPENRTKPQRLAPGTVAELGAAATGR